MIAAATTNATTAATTIARQQQEQQEPDNNRAGVIGNLISSSEKNRGHAAAQFSPPKDLFIGLPPSLPSCFFPEEEEGAFCGIILIER